MTYPNKVFGEVTYPNKVFGEVTYPNKVFGEVRSTRSLDFRGKIYVFGGSEELG